MLYKIRHIDSLHKLLKIMKELMNLELLKNWRADVLFLLLVVGLLLLFADSKSLAALVWTKIAALGFGLAFCGLWRKWDDEGKIEELSSLVSEE